MDDGLLDLGPLAETITVRGKPLEVFGISVDGLCYLIKNFPEFKMVMQQKTSEITPEKLFETGPRIAAMIIAIGLTDASRYDDLKGWERHIILQAKKVKALGIMDQLNLLAAIFKLTLPDGVGPFVLSLNSLTATIRGGSTEPGTRSPEAFGASLQMVDPNVIPTNRRLNS